MSIIYDGYKITPAPFVSISKEYQRRADGKILGAKYTLNVVGSLLAFAGSPDSDGTLTTTTDLPNEIVPDNQRLRSILSKQEALRGIFAHEGRLFEIQPWDNSQSMKCNPRVLSIQFPDELWYNKSTYTITLEADKLYFTGFPEGEDDFDDYYISDLSESWTVDTNDEQAVGLGKPRTYRLTHTVSATGKRFYDDAGALVKEAWEQARDYILNSDIIGYNNRPTEIGESSINDTYSPYNHVRTESIDEASGGFTLTEIWLLSYGSVIEDFTVVTKSSIDSGLTTVSIDGNITGLETRDNNDISLTTTRYDNAIATYNSTVEPAMLTRAQTYSGTTLNITPTTQSVSKNPVTGTINYSFEYDTRPSNYVTGSRSESIAINDVFGVDGFAVIPVLGRNRGPRIQSLSTHRERSRSLSIELLFPPATGVDLDNAFYNQKPSIASLATIQAIVDAANPSLHGGLDVYVSDQQQNWEPRSGRFSLNVSWVYELTNPDTII